MLPLKLRKVLSLSTRKRLLRIDNTLKRGIASNGKPFEKKTSYSRD